MYYTAKLHPNPDQQNMLFAGCADKKVYQWDANSGDLVQVRARVRVKFRVWDKFWPGSGSGSLRRVCLSDNPAPHSTECRAAQALLTRMSAPLISKF